MSRGDIIRFSKSTRRRTLANHMMAQYDLTPERIAGMSNEELRALPRVGPTMARELRKISQENGA